MPQGLQGKCLLLFGRVDVDEISDSCQILHTDQR